MATLKALEIAITGVSKWAWELEAREANFIRAKVKAQHGLDTIIEAELADVALAALYHAGKLVIGCDPEPKPIYGHSGVDREIWGMKVSASNSLANRAFSIGDW